MTKEELLKRSNGFAVHTPTESLYKQVCALVDSLGLLRASGIPYTEYNQWFNYAEETCIDFRTRCITNKSAYPAHSTFKIISAAIFIRWFEGDVPEPKPTPKPTEPKIYRERVVKHLSEIETQLTESLQCIVNGVVLACYDHVNNEYNINNSISTDQAIAVAEWVLHMESES